MANATLQELLLPQVILRVVSRIRNGQGALGRWLGFQPDRFDNDTVTLSGPNTLIGSSTVRTVTYRVFDNARVVSKARAPGTGPATVARNEMGQAMIACARFHQKIPMLYEDLGNLSPMIGPNSQVDAGGQNFIMLQEKFLQRQFNNMVEMMAAGMLRDSLYFYMSGDNWFPNFTAPSGSNIGFQVNFQIPSGNKNQLNMLGTGNILTIPWDNTGAPIMNNLASIQAAYAQLSGYAMTDVWVNSLTWNDILLNTQIRNVGGSSNTVFAEFERRPETFMDGQPGNQFYGVLRALPHIKFHLCDDVIALNTDIDPSYSNAPSGASLSKIIPDNMAIFCTEPSSDWTQLYHGGEYIVENPGMPAIPRMGYYYWKEYTTQPSAVELIGLLNAIPLLYVPKVIAPATVKGF